MTEDTTGYQNPILKIMQSQSQSQGAGGQANNPMANNLQNPMNINSMKPQRSVRIKWEWGNAKYEKLNGTNK